MTEHILNLSYGKDSIACLEAIHQLGYPLDRIIHAEVWATDTIPTDLPPMIEFKARADEIIKQRYGLTVEHVTATNREGEKLSYEKQFFTMRHNKRIGKDCIYGFPMLRGVWCNSKLKCQPLESVSKEHIRDDVSNSSREQRVNVNIVQYLGIAADEPERKSGIPVRVWFSLWLI